MATAILPFIVFAPGFVEILEAFVDAVESVLEGHTDGHPKDVELIDEAFRAVINADAEAISLVAEAVGPLSETGNESRRSNENEGHESRGDGPNGPIRPIGKRKSRKGYDLWPPGAELRQSRGQYALDQSAGWLPGREPSHDVDDFSKVIEE
jgi:hypothetical protein